jgi:uncharacterized protein YfaS (alpha-2-macroglobulin family)
MRTYQRLETVKLRAEVRDPETNALTDPATSINMTIYQPDKTEAQASVAMTKISTGLYRYNYTIASDADLGIWKAEAKATNGTPVTVENAEFKVVARRLVL